MQNDGTGKSKNGFVWTFVAPDEHGDHDVSYVSPVIGALSVEATSQWHRGHADRRCVQRSQRRRGGLAAETRRLPRAPAALLPRGTADRKRRSI